jgi:two-component system, sensor histidine kinase
MGTGIRLEALANLAHELRSPVQALLGYLDILREEMVDYLPVSIATSSSGRTSTFTTSRKLWRICWNLRWPTPTRRHWSRKIATSPIYLPSARPLWKPPTPESILRSTLTSIRQIGKVRLMRRPLKSILINRAVTAIKFTSQGSVAILAKRVTADDGRATLEIRVDDTGSGIDPTMLAPAFKRCTQLSNSSERLFRGMASGSPSSSIMSRCWARGSVSTKRAQVPHLW